MVEGWEWDQSLFEGSARYYAQGRLPYPPGLADAFASAADLSGSPRLIDVGCGTGMVALALAHLFTEVVGVDAQPEMVVEAERLARARGIENARWLSLRAEELPTAGLRSFRYATFAQSFHWMDRDAVAAGMFEMLEPGGAFVHVEVRLAPADDALRHPRPPDDEITELRKRYLGPERRAGRGVIRHGTPGDEWAVLQRAGFEAASVVAVPGRQELERSIDDVVAYVFSNSATAPHQFGNRLGDFERELRLLLQDAASPSGLFSELAPEVALVMYKRP